MKRTGAIVRLVICLLTAAILCALLVIGINNGFSFFVTSFSSYSYDNPDLYRSGEIETDDFGEIKNVSIRWISGNVSVVPAKDGMLRASEEGASGEDDSMRYLIKDGTLYIQFSKPHGFSFKSDPKKQLSVEIPEVILKKLNSFKLEVTSADALIDSVCASRFSVDSVSGNVVADGVSAEKFIIETVSGDMDISGEVNDLSSESVSGDVKLHTKKAPTTIDCDSVSGDVTLSFVECSGFIVSFDKVSGSFSSDFPVYERGDERVYAKGGSLYSFETVSGDVSIRNAVETAPPTAAETTGE